MWFLGTRIWLGFKNPRFCSECILHRILIWSTGWNFQPQTRWNKTLWFRCSIDCAIDCLIAIFSSFSFFIVHNWKNTGRNTRGQTLRYIQLDIYKWDFMVRLYVLLEFLNGWHVWYLCVLGTTAWTFTFAGFQYGRSKSRSSCKLPFLWLHCPSLWLGNCILHYRLVIMKYGF